MQITQEFNHEELEQFKSKVWPAADAEHYIDSMPHFFQKEFTLVATEEKGIVGYGTVTIDTGVAHLEPLMVATDRKGEGIGTALLQAAETTSKKMDAHKIWLETGMHWKAKDFYIKNGYTLRTVLPNHNGHQDFVLMDKMI